MAFWTITLLNRKVPALLSVSGSRWITASDPIMGAEGPTGTTADWVPVIQKKIPLLDMEVFHIGRRNPGFEGLPVFNQALDHVKGHLMMAAGLFPAIFAGMVEGIFTGFHKGSLLPWNTLL